MKWLYSLVLPLATAQVFLKGICPKTPAFRYFNWDRYLGTWYEQERFFSAHQRFGKCWVATYARNIYTGNLSLRLTFKDFLFKKKQNLFMPLFIGNAVDAPNYITYTVPGFPFLQEQFQVLDTDYENWTIEYSCKHGKLLGASQFAWISTRSPRPSLRVINEAKFAMQSLGFNVKFFKQTSKKCYKH